VSTNIGYPSTMITTSTSIDRGDWFPAEATKHAGTVSLPTGGRAKTGSYPPEAIPWRYPLTLRGDARFGDLAPHDDRPGTKRANVG